MTSKLEKYLARELYTRFDCYTIKQNHRPPWLEGLELDFYIEEIKLAAEVQGEQHYKFVEYFHRTPERFAEQQKRDYKKDYLCRLNRVRLVEIFTEKDADLFVQLVKEKSRIVDAPILEEIQLDGSFSKEQKSAAKNYNKCVRYFLLYRKGLLKATEAQVHMWTTVIQNGVKVNGRKVRF